MHTKQSTTGTLSFLQQEALPALFVLGKSRVKGPISYALLRNYKLWNAIVSKFHAFRMEEMKKYAELDKDGNFVIEEVENQGKVAKFKDAELRVEFETMLEKKMNEEIEIPFYSIRTSDVQGIDTVSSELLFVLDFLFQDDEQAEASAPLIPNLTLVEKPSIVTEKDVILTSEEVETVNQTVNDLGASILDMEEAEPKPIIKL